MENKEYNNADLNELFNFSYNFDLLKDIIETLLKNQQNLQKQVDTMLEERKEFQLLKFDLKNAKEEIKKLSEIFQSNDDNETEKEKEDKKDKLDKSDKQDKVLNDNEVREQKPKVNVDREDFGFDRVRNFDQLKQKILELRKELEKTKNDFNAYRDNMNLKYNRLVGESKEKEESLPINERIDELEKKIRFLLGNISLEDIEKEGKYRQSREETERKRIMNLQEINRKLSYLEIHKMDASVYDMNNDMFNSRLEQLKSRLNELIENFYGKLGDKNEINKNIKFVKLNDFEKYKANVGYELERIWTEIGLLKENNNLLFEKIKDQCTLKDIAANNNYLLQKIDELLEGLNKKFVLKADNANAFKNLEEQFKRIVLLLSTKVDHEADNWLLAKKPINGYSCAACESYIGDLKEENIDKYINWKKMPMRDREKEKEKEPEKEKIYRLGNGYSHVLKMVGVDNNGNYLLNPNSNKDLRTFFPIENNKKKEGVDLQIRKPTFPERTKSAHSKDKKEKTFQVIKQKNNGRKLPKIKGNTASSDDFDKIIDNPNQTLIQNDNYISPKITKVMRKSHSKFNV